MLCAHHWAFVVVRCILVEPTGEQLRNVFSFRCTTRSHLCLRMRTQISYLLCIAVKPSPHVFRAVLFVVTSLVGIRQHIGHTLITADHHKPTIRLVVEHIQFIPVVGQFQLWRLFHTPSRISPVSMPCRHERISLFHGHLFRHLLPPQRASQQHKRHDGDNSLSFHIGSMFG